MRMLINSTKNNSLHLGKYKSATLKVKIRFDIKSKKRRLGLEKRRRILRLDSKRMQEVTTPKN